ncbi:MAG: hypothetical protein EBQ95_04595 [Gammaproteobacteria bacterium]|nr:hypothetical protein [Gammaproteobacteria bacterium]
MFISKSSKQSFYFATLIISNFIATAGSIGPIQNSILLKDGFYLAGSLGVMNLQDRFNHSYNPEAHQLSSTGILGGGYGGYDYGMTDKFRIAIEGFIDAVGVTTSISHPPYSLNASQKYQAGGRILPEYIFSKNIVGHWIFGYVNGRFNFMDNGVYGYANSGFNKNGFQTGLGFTTILQDNILVRLDGFYNIFSSQTTVGPSTSPPAYQTYQNAFGNLIGEISLIYKF